MSCGTPAPDWRRSMANSSAEASRDSTSGPLLKRSARTGAGNTILASRSLSSSAIRLVSATGSTKRKRRRVGGASRWTSRSSSACTLLRRLRRNAQSSSSKGAQAASRRAVSAISGSRSRRAANRSREREILARIRLPARPHDRACRACGARNAAQNRRAAGAGNRRWSARPSWRASARLRSGHRVVCTSGNGASRLGRLSRPLSTTSWPTRANHSDASGVGVSATAAADTARLQLCAHALAQVSCAAEEPQAATHFEQQAVRWLEADTRREELESRALRWIRAVPAHDAYRVRASAAREPAPARS